MKNILLSLTLAAGTLVASAQTMIIPKAGLTLSSIVFANEQKIKPGFNGGLAVVFTLNEELAIQPEVQFIQKGCKTSTAEGDSKLTLNYLDLPILLKASLGADRLKFFVNAGPYVGIGLGGKSTGKVTISHNGVTEVVDVELKVRFSGRNSGSDGSGFNRFDFGLQVGGGAVIANSVLIDLRYGLGLSPLLEKNDGTTSEFAKNKNSVFQFTVGVPIVLKKK
ncbi:MAG: porin family protein [Bacteroidota bacterium]